MSSASSGRKPRGRIEPSRHGFPASHGTDTAIWSAIIVRSWRDGCATVLRSRTFPKMDCTPKKSRFSAAKNKNHCSPAEALARQAGVGHVQEPQTTSTQQGKDALMQWMNRLQRKSRLPLLVLSGTALLWFVPLRSATAQMFSANGPGEISGTQVRERMDKKKKGSNITEWVRRLRNDRPETRLEAVKSLGNSKDPKAIEHILAATEDVDIRVKVKAIEYLGTLRATDATPVLSQQLFRRDIHPAVKQKILIA